MESCRSDSEGIGPAASDSSTTDVVGIDIGGANLKYATTDRVAYSRKFEMWRRSAELAATLAEDIQRSFASSRTLAVTMTGELADCFTDRREGVEHIVRHVTEAAQQCGISQAVFYGVDGRFRNAVQARNEVDLVAAANWHALSRMVATDVCRDGLLIDVGSTTTDVIPIRDRQLATEAATDHDRLRDGSLVYVGCRRTPVCALLERITFRGRDSSVMNEWFATIDDARIVMGLQVEKPDDTDSADGKPRTKEMAANRLARVIGLDRRDVSVEDAVELANQIHAAARCRIARSVTEIGRPEARFVLSGHGDDLIDLPADAKTIRLADRLGSEVSRCAPSFAVARMFHLQETS